MAIKRILVPIDFSADALSALAYARDFAKRFKAELLLLYVVEPIYYATPTDMYATGANVAMLLDEQRRAATRQMERLGAEMRKARQTFRSMVKTGAPAHTIIETAKSGRADLVIMATHGRTGLAHVLMGSVAERVVRGAGCPVLTVRRAATAARKRRRTAKR